jgi:L-amino acid N-acyltransferase YncA
VIERGRPEHAAGIAAVYAPYVRDTAISFEVEAPDAAEIAVRMAQGFPWFVSMTDGTVDGFCSASQHRTRAAYRWAVDVSVYVATPGQGTGRALYVPLLDELRSLGYVQAFAGIGLPNAPSVGLHEALGFTPLGVYQNVGFKLGRWHDVGWWQLPLSEPPTDPAEPRRAQ